MIACITCGSTDLGQTSKSDKKDRQQCVAGTELRLAETLEMTESHRAKSEKTLCNGGFGEMASIKIEVIAETESQANLPLRIAAPEQAGSR